ncbi:TIGR02391 family protein [Pseudomonas viridiflava]|uniref:TIGR02391 family protein n=2 Tax=Pseudomonas viridiflava TaxID=33069 RepID=UPI000F0716C5|nr:TIGR02391 family protein [Pseudomonas viridiflava]
MGKKFDKDKLAGIEYHGTEGLTQRCLDALVNVIGTNKKIQSAWLLSWFDGKMGEHSLLLNISPMQQVLIKPGFTSGYLGEGPTGLSKALQTLELFQIEIDEYVVDREFHEHCIKRCLLHSDLEKLKKSRPVRPTGYRDYISRSQNWERAVLDSILLQEFPVSLNLRLLDIRLIDLAVRFFDSPDLAISTAFRRLEDIVRDRIGVHDKSGSNLFKRAFEGDQSVLHWDDLDRGEQAGKSGLFVAVFLAYRNPRAHREMITDPSEAVREFMLINQLYILEALSIRRMDQASS